MANLVTKMYRYKTDSCLILRCLQEHLCFWRQYYWHQYKETIVWPSQENMAIRRRNTHLHLLFFLCSLLSAAIVIYMSLDDGNLDHEIIENDKKKVNKEVITKPNDQPATTAKPRTLKDLKRDARAALDSCSCQTHHRSSWLKDLTSRHLVVPNILHVVRYGDTPVSLVEAICIKSYLMQQNPDRFYLHTNMVDLSNYGEHWKQL